MSALAGCLIAMAVWFADRSRHRAGRTRIRGRLEPSSRPATGRALLRMLPAWMPWVAGGAVMGWVVWTPWGTVAGAGLGIVARKGWSARRIAKEAAARDEQLADAVGSVAAAIRAGMSVQQALAFAARETQPPLADGLGEVARRVELGTPTEVAVDRWATDVGTSDARLVACVLHLHRRSGGDLPSVLDQIVTTLRDRREAAREVRGLTAQARLSGAILGFLPVGFFAFLWMTARSDIAGALHTGTGVTAVALGLVLEGLAFVWIRKLLEVR